MAFNPAVDSAVQRGARQAAFVRPDVPPETDAVFKAGRSEKTEATAEGNFRARPQFRSALEQVRSAVILATNTTWPGIAWAQQLQYKVLSQLLCALQLNSLQQSQHGVCH